MEDEERLRVYETKKTNKILGFLNLNKVMTKKEELEIMEYSNR